MAKTTADPDQLIMSHSGSPVYGSSDGIAVVADEAGVATTHDGLVAVSGGNMAMPLDRSMWCEEFIDFNGYFTVADEGATFVNQLGPWVTESEAGTSPVSARVADHDNGALQLSLSSTSEAADISLFWNDELNIDSDQGPIMIVRLQLVAQGLATDSRAWGLISAKGNNVDCDATTNNAIFKVDGANLNLLVESDDNTTNDDDNDTSVDLVAGTYYEFMVTMNPIHGHSTTDVGFYYRSVLGDDWTRLLSTTTFSFGADVACQPIINVEKSAGAGTPGVYVDYVQVMWKRN